ncbi:hypothetical protein SAMN05216404_10194 [Nitrosospira multiformis]|uniref:Uncharacterized protein n=1 Tax=Nitrosospira multiformis TaxID=1231 RepID=A0A1H8B3E1_9PROT|nr:hypothetical protein SAMN05216404_10194 [Nitrosospira multiformis]
MNPKGLPLLGLIVRGVTKVRTVTVVPKTPARTHFRVEYGSTAKIADDRQRIHHLARQTWVIAEVECG